MKQALAVTVLVGSCVSGSVLAAQGSRDEIGHVHFPVSCTPAAQAQFDHAMALLHSFVFPQDVQAFAGVATTDSSCGIAYWGVAISRRANPLVGPIDSVALREGALAANQARTIGAATARERGYIAAIGEYYRDWPRRDHAERVLAYTRAMRDLHQQYPDDAEAAVLYALSLDEAVTVEPADPTFARQRDAASILDTVLVAQPQHPGALHYLIHTYDFPSLASRGIDAATRYTAAAPSASHALHMPSHVYSMLGMWQESIAANQAALAVANAYAHAMDFMVYAYLQGAQDSAAHRLVAQSAALQRTQTPDGNPTGAVLAGYTAVAAMPARYVLERGAWGEAAALEPRHTNRVADAMTYFVRAMGAARRGEMARARLEIDTLATLEHQVAAAQQAYWAEQVGIQRQAALAWLALAEGRRGNALRLMRAAADREDASAKHVAMENRLWPMRELLGELLLRIDQPRAALTAFEASLRVARNRYRAVYGAATAARLAHDSTTARGYYQQLIALCSHRDVERPELAEARAFLSPTHAPRRTRRARSGVFQSRTQGGGPDGAATGGPLRTAVSNVPPDGPER